MFVQYQDRLYCKDINENISVYKPQIYPIYAYKYMKVWIYKDVLRDYEEEEIEDKEVMCQTCGTTLWFTPKYRYIKPRSYCTDYYQVNLPIPQ